MRIRLSDHFTYPKLLRFVFPSIVMMIFTSVYGVVDGLFVSNFVGKTAFAAVNFIMPVLMVTGALGFMLGTGGSAIVAKTLGEGRRCDANRYFTMMILAAAVGGVAVSVLGSVFLPSIAAALGAKEAMLADCVLYGRIILVANTAFMLQNMFQSFLITAEKPKLGLWITVAAGVTNMVLDALFIAVFRWGIVGAALATALSQCVGGLLPLLYFARENDSLLRLTKTRMEGRILVRACVNGSSELLSNISSSLVGMLYNAQLMRFAGEDSVAAYGVLMYLGFIFAAIFIGYCIGSAPLIGYHYGAGSTAELKNLLRKSLVFCGVCGTLLTAAAVLLAPLMADIFVGYDASLCAMTEGAFLWYAPSFLLCGFSIFGSSFFTALNNGLVSAVISLLRTLFFQVAAVLLLPLLWELDGVWISATAAELPALLLTVGALVLMRRRYKY